MLYDHGSSPKNRGGAVTEQTVEQQGTDVVLEYEYQQADMTDAVRMVLRKRPKAGLVHHPVFLACVALLGAALLVSGLQGDGGGGLAFGVMLVVWPLLMFRVPHMTARGLLRANQHHGLMRVTVGEAGVWTMSAYADVRLAWANYGSYAESDRCFVLRSPDRAGYCAAVLLKRGARTPEDVERLRALLDRHLLRV
jgi:hypothetical protein